jgi:molybdate transport system regulatory protein
MPARSGDLPDNHLHPRIRVLHRDAIALGPGKADLLEQIERDGTIARAARQLGMSYNRAWTLLQTMNECFREPLVETARGGRGRGHAGLTATGRAALALYRRMERESLAAIEPAWRELLPLLAER